MRGWLLLVACVAVGCNWGLGSDPGLTPHCAIGHVPDTGGCRVPHATIAIDGKTDDWRISGIPLDATCTSPPCDALLPDALAVAIDPCTTGTCDPNVFFRLRLAGGAAPVTTDVNVRYELVLAPTAERPAAETDALVATALGPTYEKNDVDVSPPSGATAYQLVWTPDGFEAAIPVSYLPLRGAAIASVFAARATGSTWTPVSDPAPHATICWDTYPDLDDPCDVAP